MSPMRTKSTNYSRHTSSMPVWVWSALHVTDVSTSCDFYQKQFDCVVLYRGREIALIEGEQREVCFLATPPRGNYGCGAADAVRKFDGQCLALVHAPDKVKDGVNNGNVLPHRGFGHIAFNCADVYIACKQFEIDGIQFKKRPDEGRMRGIAFILDPDGYWIELVPRNKDHPFDAPFNFSQTMIRVKDADKSITFYTDVLGLQLGHKMAMHDFTNYFLSSKEKDCNPFTNWWPVLELTHNHEFTDPGAGYHTGRTPPYGFLGFAFAVSSEQELNACVERAKAKGCEAALSGTNGICCNIFDPDGYYIQIFIR